MGLAGGLPRLSWGLTITAFCERRHFRRPLKKLTRPSGQRHSRGPRFGRANSRRSLASAGARPQQLFYGPRVQAKFHAEISAGWARNGRQRLSHASSSQERDRSPLRQARLPPSEPMHKKARFSTSRKGLLPAASNPDHSQRLGSCATPIAGHHIQTA